MCEEYPVDVYFREDLLVYPKGLDQVCGHSIAITAHSGRESSLAFYQPNAGLGQALRGTRER